MARPSSAAQAKRMLALLHILQEEARIPSSKLADLLQVSVTQVESDLEKLACCGTDDFTRIPIYIEEGEVHITGDMPALQEPLRLSAAEARALVAALQAGGLDSNDPLVKKLTKAAAVTTFDSDTVRNIVSVGEDPTVGEILKIISLAIERHMAVRIAYQNPGKEPTDRLVEPLQLMVEAGVWYLEAFCRRAGDLRTFRVDRIHSAELTAEKFAPRDLDLAATILPTQDLPRAKIALSSRVNVSLLGWPDMRLLGEDEDGKVVVSVPYAGTTWIARQIVSLLGEATVISPPDIRTAVAETARKIRAGL